MIDRIFELAEQFGVIPSTRFSAPLLARCLAATLTTVTDRL
jgi:hypothetical protein